MPQKKNQLLKNGDHNPFLSTKKNPTNRNEDGGGLTIRRTHCLVGEKVEENTSEVIQTTYWEYSKATNMNVFALIRQKKNKEYLDHQNNQNEDLIE